MPALAAGIHVLDAPRTDAGVGGRHEPAVTEPAA